MKNKIIKELKILGVAVMDNKIRQKDVIYVEKVMAKDYNRARELINSIKNLLDSDSFKALKSEGNKDYLKIYELLGRLQVNL